MSGQAFERYLDFTGATTADPAIGAGYAWSRIISYIDRHRAATAEELSGRQGTVEWVAKCGEVFAEVVETIDETAPFAGNMADFFGDAVIGGDHRAPRIQLQESYNFGDQDGWLLGDRGLPLHAGYSSIADEDGASFVGWC